MDIGDSFNYPADVHLSQVRDRVRAAGKRHKRVFRVVVEYGRVRVYRDA